MNTRNGNTREQGVALLMTLGVLSLILILAMSFSFTARTELALSTNNTDLVRTRMLADSGVNRAIALIGDQYAPAQYTASPTAYPDLVYPGTATSSSYARFTQGLYGGHSQRNYWISTQSSQDTIGLGDALTLSIPVGTVGSLGYIPAQSDTQLETLGASWEHIHQLEGDKDVNGDGTIDQHIVARLGFIVLDASGTIDPNGVLTLNCEPSWNATALTNLTGYTGTEFLDLNADGAWDSSSGAAGGTWDSFRAEFLETSMLYRPGLSPQEIQIDTASGGAGYVSLAQSFWDLAPYVKPASLPDRRASWNSWRQVCQTAGRYYAAHPSEKPFNNIAGWSSADTNTYLATYFPYSYDVEAYHDFTANADYHRLDLWAVDWEKTWAVSDLADLHSSPKAFWTASGDIDAMDPSTDQSAAQALAGFVSDTGADISNQVLMNIVDLCDDDDPDDNGTQPIPQFSGSAVNAPLESDLIGIEMTPYINEILFSASYTRHSDSASPPAVVPPVPPPGHEKRGDIDIDVYVELVNIYSEAATFDRCEVKFDLEWTGIGVLGTGVISINPDPNHDKMSDNGSVSVPANGYRTLHYKPDGTVYTGLTLPEGVAEQIELKVSNVRVILLGKDRAGASYLQDFAFPISSGTSVTIADVLDGTDDTDVHYASLEVSDPRCNTSQVQTISTGTFDNWLAHENATSDPSTLDAQDDGSGAGSVNDHAGDRPASYACDTEGYSTANPTTAISTAYIANRPDITYWELGAVHRGEPWRTVNLRAYSSANTNSNRSYSNGDGILLDQIKLGSFSAIPGRVNVNSPTKEVWRRVLYGLRLGQEYADVHGNPSITSGGTDSLITDTTLDSMAGDIVAQIGGAALTRGAIAGVPTLIADTSLADFSPTNDRQQEEIVGKIANLLTSRQNLFQALVVAQAVKDVGPNGQSGSSEYVEYDPGKFLRLQSEQRILATLYRDAFTNRFRIVRMEYLED